MMMGLLVYSEESYIASMLKRSAYLQKFSIHTVYGKEQLQDALHSQPIGLILVHIIEDGTESPLQICRWIHEECHIPYMVIGERMQASDALTYLRAGALECMTDECKMDEITIRVENVLKAWEAMERQWNRLATREQTRHLYVDKQYQYVVRGSEQIYLSPIEFRLLCYLIEHPNQIIHLDQLLEVGWGQSTQVGRDELYVYIRSLRRKLDVPGHSSCIKSIYGKGYLFSCPELEASENVPKVAPSKLTHV
jgi:two-component system, OmpR family, response regulator